LASLHPDQSTKITERKKNIAWTEPIDRKRTVAPIYKAILKEKHHWRFQTANPETTQENVFSHTTKKTV